MSGDQLHLPLKIDRHTLGQIVLYSGDDLHLGVVEVVQRHLQRRRPSRRWTADVCVGENFSKVSASWPPAASFALVPYLMPPR